MNFNFALVGAVLATTSFSVMPVSASADTMDVTYFTVAENGDPDFSTNPNPCCATFYTNEVQSALGPGGLPVYNPSYGGPALSSVNGAGELTWWSPSQNPYVVETGAGTVTLPYANYNFFPPSGTGANDLNGFQAAIFSGTLVVPSAESVTFSLGSDDNSFLALGNQIIAQNGGIHGLSVGSVVTSILDPGSYALTLFYLDRHITGAGLYFSLDTQGVSITAPVPATPLPSTWLLFLSGCVGLGCLSLSGDRKNAAALAACIGFDLSTCAGHSEMGSSSVGSSSGARELLTRFDTGHRCNKSSGAGLSSSRPAAPLSHGSKSFSASRTGMRS